MGVLDFCFPWLFPAQQQRAEGWYGNALPFPAAGNAWSPLKRVVGKQEGGLEGRHKAGRRALASLLSPCYLMPAEKLIDLRYLSLCIFRPIFTKSERLCPALTCSLINTQEG